jgi:hypothetical protein
VVINKNLTLRGAGARSTAIDGNDDGCQATLVVTGGATVTLSGLTVTRGGILNSGTLTVNDCAITGNTGNHTLSGIENTISGAAFLNNCTVTGNAYHGVANAGTMILNGCIVPELCHVTIHRNRNDPHSAVCCPELVPVGRLRG